MTLFTFLAINLFGNKEYWLDIFWPKVPVWLKCPVPMMPVIELFGIFTKPFALMVRLFANIFAGHAIVLSLTCVIFITCQLGAAIGAGLSTVSVVMMIFMDCLELLVAFIQAYVFTMLSAVFIGLAHQEEENDTTLVVAESYQEQDWDGQENETEARVSDWDPEGKDAVAGQKEGGGEEKEEEEEKEKKEQPEDLRILKEFINLK